MSEPLEVFLSYAREDRPKVEQVYDSLRAEGLNPWMDTKNIRAGERWSSVIGRAIRDADFMLVFVSRNSVSKRGYVQREIKAALSILSERLEDDIFLIPVRLDDSDLPEPLAHIQYIDLFEKEGWHKLLQAIRQGRERREAPAAGMHELRKELRQEFQSDRRVQKPHIFIAMPFNVEMEDIYYYGIQRAVDANDFECERIDKTAFTGDILEQIKSKIQTAAAVIAELTGGNPNVHLELGYAWGTNIPTILLLQEGEELCFDVRGQRCLRYYSIRNLEELLTAELASLKVNGRILSPQS